MTLFALLTNSAWMLVPLTYGFLARVLAGPKISPLGRFAVQVAVPRFHKYPALAAWERFVPGPPKRFAQALGALFTVSASVLWLSVGWDWARWMLLPLVVAASLEGFAGYCLGCTVFGWMIRFGLVPESVCLECSDLSARYRAVTDGAAAPSAGQAVN
jgi:hypothetical protein